MKTRQKMKKDVDALRDVGQPVSDSTLVLNLLCGVNSKYNTIAGFIAATLDMMFNKALDQLTLKELRLVNEDKVAVFTALVASSFSGACGSARCFLRLLAATAAASQEKARRRWPATAPPFSGLWICFNPRAS